MPIQQGWECPICHTIYSPTVSFCNSPKCHPEIYKPVHLPQLTEEYCAIRDYYKRNPDQYGKPVYIACHCSNCSPRF